MQEKLKATWNYINTLIKWLLIASIVGIISGGVGTLFYHSVEYAAQSQQRYPWLLWLLPLGGVGIVGLYHLCKMSDDLGTDLVIDSIRSAKRIPARMAPLIFFSTALTHLLGGSAGRLGAALQIGGSLGSLIGRWIRLDEKDLRIITMCGMSGVFAALFATPLTAAIFSMEVISVGVIYYVAFIPCIISALIGFCIATAYGVKPVLSVLVNIPPISILATIQVIALSALCAALSIAFCTALLKSRKWLRKFFPNAYIRVMAGALFIMAVTYLVGSRDYNGVGTAVIERAVAGIAQPEAFALKILVTAVTLGAGFKGGEIAPTFFIGATFGCVAGGLLGLPPAFGAAIGLIALFCGVVNCPIASLFLSVELFGAQGLLLFGVACAVSYMLSGYYGLYSSQRIVYSKLEPHLINRNTHSK